MDLSNPEPVHPGVILYNEFINPLRLESLELANLMGLNQIELSYLKAGRLRITAPIAIKLAKVFNTSPEYWMYLQVQYNLAIAKNKVDVSQIKEIPIPDKIYSRNKRRKIKIPDALKPLHPGIILYNNYFVPLKRSIRDVSRRTKIYTEAFSRLLKGNENITPAKAFKLSKAFNTTPDYWMMLQVKYDLAIIDREKILSKVEQLLWPVDEMGRIIKD